MLQALLQERFRLGVHRETRQLPVYQLVVGKGGAKLQPSKEGSCTPYLVNGPPPRSGPGNFCGLHAVSGLSRALEGKGVTLAMLAPSLSRTYTAALGRNIIDGTGLSGAFDVHLEWASDPMTEPTPGAAPSIFTALLEQLGLKLESAKGPVEVLVIEHVEKPSAN
jgi:uncharacterized protein (TIGR03435 family)